MPYNFGLQFMHFYFLFVNPWPQFSIERKYWKESHEVHYSQKLAEEEIFLLSKFLKHHQSEGSAKGEARSGITFKFIPKR